MVLGRPLTAVPRGIRDATARGVLATPLKHALARLYTMGWS